MRAFWGQVALNYTYLCSPVSLSSKASEPFSSPSTDALQPITTDLTCVKINWYKFSKGKSNYYKHVSLRTPHRHIFLSLQWSFFFILPELRQQFRHWRQSWDIQTRPHQLGRVASGGACQLYPPVTQSETENQTNIWSQHLIQINSLVLLI